VRAAMEVTRGLGGTPDLRYSTRFQRAIGPGNSGHYIGAGRAGQRAHSPDEFANMENPRRARPAAGSGDCPGNRGC